MNSLEFIEKEIEATKRDISIFKSDIRKTKELEEKLNNLQQIKTELEAWEVVKRYTDTSEDTINTEYYFIKSMDSEFETLKKALEVKDEKETK